MDTNTAGHHANLNAHRVLARGALTRAGISWSDTLRLTNAELLAMGVPARHITALRVELTGHPRSMDKDWWKSIGLWGSVYTTEEIAFILGVSKGRVLAHARGCGLRTAKPGKELEASMLAAVLYLHRDEDDMAGRYGVLEVERRRYILEAEAIVGKGESLAGIKSDDWRMMWAKASQQLAPTGLPADITERRAQIDHLRQTRPAPTTQSGARAHKTSSRRGRGAYW